MDEEEVAVERRRMRMRGEGGEERAGSATAL